MTTITRLCSQTRPGAKLCRRNATIHKHPYGWLCTTHAAHAFGPPDDAADPSPPAAKLAPAIEQAIQTLASRLDPIEEFLGDHIPTPPTDFDEQLEDVISDLLSHANERVNDLSAEVEGIRNAHDSRLRALESFLTGYFEDHSNSLDPNLQSLLADAQSNTTAELNKLRTYVASNARGLEAHLDSLTKELQDQVEKLESAPPPPNPGPLARALTRLDKIEGFLDDYLLEPFDGGAQPLQGILANLESTTKSRVDTLAQSLNKFSITTEADILDLRNRLQAATGEPLHTRFHPPPEPDQDEIKRLNERLDLRQQLHNQLAETVERAINRLEGRLVAAENDLDKLKGRTYGS